MAYPRARCEDPLKYEEYDPTPFSGGYDQVALYGRPKSPSAETCYPISEGSHHEGGDYGAETTPYLPGKSSGFKYGVDEDRPSFQQEDPPHGSDDSYGRIKPSFYATAEAGYGSGYGRPSSYEEEGGGYGSGYGRTKPPFEEAGYGRPGYGGGGFGRQHGEEGYGGYNERPSQEHESFGYGGRKSSGYEGEEGRYGGGFGEFGGEEGYGGRKNYSDYEGDRPSYFGDERPAPPPDEGYGGYQGEEHRHGHHHKHHWRHDDE